MDTSGVLREAFGRVQGVVGSAVQGLSEEQLAYRPDEESNSIAWLVWHLTRIQDDHIAEVAGSEQVWTGAGWADRFGLPFDSSATGYGHSPDDVAEVRGVPADLLTGYYDAVHDATLRYLGSIGAEDLDRVIDDRWDPPVTLGVRLVSVLSDDLQHAGQASFLRGLVERRG